MDNHWHNKGGMMENYDSAPETMRHIAEVGDTLNQFSTRLHKRVLMHDTSKLQSQEKPVFDEFTPKLRRTTYGSEEYQGFMKDMGLALEHHYEMNEHHPEHWENGIRDMSLIDIVEMFCDWLAATKRHADGDIRKSIEINQKRFGYSDDLKAIFKTLWMNWRSDEPGPKDQPAPVDEVQAALRTIKRRQWIDTQTGKCEGDPDKAIALLERHIAELTASLAQEKDSWKRVHRSLHAVIDTAAIDIDETRAELAAERLAHEQTRMALDKLAGKLADVKVVISIGDATGYMERTVLTKENWIKWARGEK